MYQYNTSDDDDASPSTIFYTSYNNISRRARRAYPASRICFQTSRHLPWSNADRPFDARATCAR